MKKIAAIILSAVMLSTCIVCMTGCYDPTDEFVSDGDFVYYYMGNWHKWMGNTGEDSEDCYTIVGINEEGLKEKIYVPAYYNGKEVRYTFLKKGSPWGDAGEYGVDIYGETIYFPYTHKVKDSLYFFYGACEDCYFTNCDEEYIRRARGLLYSIYHMIRGRGLCSPLFYERFKTFLYDGATIEEEGGYILRYQESNSWVSVLQKANTSYMFNYEGAPNEGYFFINDFERGGKIEKTPYEPQRERYTFAGWYKEPECINVWNFEQDTLPAAEYDENGELIYTETKLYAKWETASDL